MNYDRRLGFYRDKYLLKLDAVSLAIRSGVIFTSYICLRGVIGDYS